MVKDPPANSWDSSSIPGPGRLDILGQLAPLAAALCALEPVLYTAKEATTVISLHTALKRSPLAIAENYTVQQRRLL